MEFKEGFNPGQNNTFTKVVMGAHSQFINNVNELTIINNGTSEDKGAAAGNKKGGMNSSDEMAVQSQKDDLAVVKDDIVTYVKRIASKVNSKWNQNWEKFWRGLLDEDIIESEISKISKQQGTTFNRMFICKIIHYLDKKGFYKDPYQPCSMTRALERGKDQHSIRTHALNLLPDDNIQKRIDRYVENFKLKPEKLKPKT